MPPKDTELQICYFLLLFRPEGTPRKEDNVSDPNLPNAEEDLWEEHYDDVSMTMCIGCGLGCVLFRRRSIGVH